MACRIPNRAILISRRAGRGRSSFRLTNKELSPLAVLTRARAGHRRRSTLGRRAPGPRAGGRCRSARRCLRCPTALSLVECDVTSLPRSGSNRAGGGGGLAGPLHSVGARTTRGRVAEWPVADPILRVLVLTQENAMAKSIARMRRENREDAGRSDRTRPAAKRPLLADSRRRMADRFLWLECHAAAAAG